MSLFARISFCFLLLSVCSMVQSQHQHPDEHHPQVELQQEHHPEHPAKEHNPLQADVSISVDGRRRYQKIDGFGATLTIFENDGVFKRHDHNQPERVTATEAQRDGIAKMIYKDLGISRTRVVLEGFEPRNDNADPNSMNASGFDWNVVDAEINFVGLGRSAGLQTWWTSSEITSQRDAWRRKDHSPCALNPAMIDEEVEWLLAAALHFKERNMELKFMAINNEPDLCSSGHDPKIKIEDMVTIVKRLGKRLLENGLQTRLVISDGWIPANAIQYMQAVLNDHEARSYVGALAYHSYDGMDNPETFLTHSGQSNLPHGAAEIRRKIQELASQYGLPVWMTEVCYCSPRDFSDFDLVRARLNHLHDELTITNASAFDVMNLFFLDRPKVRDELVHIYFRPDGALDRYEISTYGYLLSHYSRFVTPGSMRVGAESSNPGIRVTAFQQTNGGLVLVVLNNTQDEIKAQAKLEQLQQMPEVFSVVTSTEDDMVRRGQDIIAKNQPLVFTLPPRSVVTYYGAPAGAVPEPGKLSRVNSYRELAKEKIADPNEPPCQDCPPPADRFDDSGVITVPRPLPQPKPKEPEPPRNCGEGFSFNPSDNDKDGIFDECEQYLAEKFAPIVFHSMAETNWPVNVDWFLARTRLMFYDDDCTPDLDKTVTEPNTQDDILRWEFARGCGAQRVDYSDGTRSNGKQRTFYLEDVDLEYRSGSNNSRDWTTYFHAYPGLNKGITVQYWRFYAYNNAINDHGGDWEGIHVHLKEDLTPLSVSYMGHTGIETVAWFDLTVESTHPHVYSEGGGHASLPYADRLGYFIEGMDVGDPDTYVRQETWTGGQTKWFDEITTQSGALINVGSKTAPLNNQVFIRYSGIWGSPGIFFGTSGYWGPPYNETAMRMSGYVPFITAWCNQMRNTSREECSPEDTSR